MRESIKATKKLKAKKLGHIVGSFSFSSELLFYALNIKTERLK